MKRVHFVRFTFTAPIEAESDCDALRDAAINLKYGIENARRLQLEVTGLGPLPVQTPAPQPVEVPTATDQPSTPILVDAVDDKMPF
jgi:hypothetical protein